MHVLGRRSSDPDGDAFTYLWNFGDATATSTSATPCILFAIDGTYTVTLTLTDVWGKAASTTLSIMIQSRPTNAAPAPVIGTPICVVGSARSTVSARPTPTGIRSRTCGTSGTAATSTTVSPSHTYTVDGTYTVTLTVTDCVGRLHHVDTGRHDRRAGRQRGAYPGDQYAACAAGNCTFSSVGTVDPNGDSFTYLWNFGDTTNSTAANPSHTYAAAGTFTVTLTVTDGWGRFNSATRVVTIVEPPTNLPPVPVIVDPPSCVARVCTFSSAGSADPNGDAFTRVWSWGDGTPNTTSTTVTQAHTYAAAGTYTVTLTLTDWWGDARSTTLRGHGGVTPRSLES